MLASYLAQTPLFLVWLAGIILSLVSWRRHPKVSLLTFIAIAGLFIASLISTYLSSWLTLMLRDQGWSVRQMGSAFMAKDVLLSVAKANSWGFLLTAIFGWRGTH